MAPRGEARNEVLYVQLHRRMVESGEWDRLSAVLMRELNEYGWLDDMRHRSKEMARGMERPTVEQLMAGLRAHAEASVPAGVRQQVVGMLRQYMEKQVDG
ncbi:hypothetical protein BKA93DRAFT_826494 [Sparassis latifolia]|uniref:Transcription and mRNA export factor SUS1 n=1 Tax=Sparassis crispa TaxID=139825 RepID=A0A401GU91_9APHY|nr:Transcription and mRNA export factor SUS1 [Sparassis crispa]GBE85749.1 Transcription and mRNA export factor SUS1 [Sparassis crispa]